jgi:hypothetical protein
MLFQNVKISIYYHISNVISRSVYQLANAVSPKGYRVRIGERFTILNEDGPSRGLLILASFAVLFNLSILLYFAATATMWYDEVDSFFVAKLPLSEMLGLMSNNYDEDAPAFNFLQHYWQVIAGYNPFLLRLLPLLLWIASVIGVGFLVNRLAGKKAMYCALIITALLPYHWIYPVAMRWYSLATATGVWNLYFFICLIRSEYSIRDFKRLSPLLLASMVALTGAATWYTVYYAPVIAVGELAVVLIARYPLKAICAWAVAWTGAVVLYLPWMQPFLRQLAESPGNRYSIEHTISSLYTMSIGVFSVPNDVWISLPLLIASITGGVLAIRHWSVAKIPLLVGGVTIAMFLVFGVIDLSRMLFVTVLFSSGIGISVAAMLYGEKPSAIMRLAMLIVSCLALIGLGGSLLNISSRSDWFTYRWIDQVEVATQRINLNHPDALLLSNSSAVAFYAQDPFGSELTKFHLNKGSKIVSDTKVWNTLLKDDSDYKLLIEQAIASQEDVIYVHHAFFTSIGSNQELDSVVAWLEHLGLETVSQWQSTPIKDGVARFLNLENHPSYRITGIHLRKPFLQPNGH